MNLPDWWSHPKPYAIMDCLQGMRELPDKCVDLVLTDPPYGIDIASNPFRQKFEKSDWDKKTPEMTIFKEIFRISKNQIIWGGNYFALHPSQGFLIWDKQQPEDFTSSMCEYAWMSFQKPAKMFSFRVITEKKLHPTQKPIPLFEWILKNYSEPGEIVLDPFLGSGTTLRACRETGRIGLGFEINPDYEPIIQKRMMEKIPEIERWF